MRLIKAPLLNLSHNSIIRKYHKAFFALVIGFFLFLYLEFHGIIWHNYLFTFNYEVKVLDVSNHQGTIDWRKVADSNKYQLVYIKATEGNDFTDDYFLKNWQGAKNNGFIVGAYHFFSIRSSGKQQADLFIATVPIESSSLPPVIDIEIDTTKDPEEIRNEIQELANAIEKHYHKRPILYVMYDTYNTYINGYFLDYDLWIRDVFKFPTLNREWLIWQFNNRGRVEGINGYVDINVFNGKKQDLTNLTQSNALPM